MQNWSTDSNAAGFDNKLFNPTNTKETILAKVKEPAVFRPQPAFDAQGNASPMRTGDGPQDFGDWVYAIPAVYFWGLNPVSFVTLSKEKAAGDAEHLAKYPVDVVDKTLFEIRNTVKKQQHTEFAAITAKDNRNRIVDAKTFAFVQGFIGQLGDKTLAVPAPCVYGFKASAADALLTLLNQGYHPAYTDKDGTPVLASPPTLTTLIDPEKGQCLLVGKELVQQTEQPKWGQQSNRIQQSNSGSSFTRFTVSLGQVMPLPNEIAAQHWVPWNQIIQILTRKEQWGMVCRAIGPQATAFAGRDEIENLPDICRAHAERYLQEQFGMPSPQQANQPQYGPANIQQGPPQPQYGTPQQPQHGQPQAPQYGTPQGTPPNPTLQQPQAAQPSYQQAPQAPAQYTPPVQPVPAAGTYQQPAAPQGFPGFAAPTPPPTGSGGFADSLPPLPPAPTAAVTAPQPQAAPPAEVQAMPLPQGYEGATPQTPGAPTDTRQTVSDLNAMMAEGATQG